MRGKYVRSVTFESQILHHPPWIKTFSYKQVSGMVISHLTGEEEAQISHKLNQLTQDEQWTVCGNQEDFLSVMMSDFNPGHYRNQVLLTCEACRLNKQEGF